MQELERWVLKVRPVETHKTFSVFDYLLVINSTASSSRLDAPALPGAALPASAESGTRPASRYPAYPYPVPTHHPYMMPKPYGYPPPYPYTYLYPTGPVYMVYYPVPANPRSDAPNPGQENVSQDPL